MTQYFLVENAGTTIKLNKGITEAEVNTLLGDKYKTEPAKVAGDKKRVYDFKKVGSKNVYKVLLRGGVLEWIMKTS